ncbi:MAG: hypothetical protein WC492_00830 [Candidatus Micrarchaeia archaeon]
MKFLKGQYFSFDAIIATVIFVMALSILFNHWYAARSQMDEQGNFLQSEAHRISNIFLGVGDYSVKNVKGNYWYQYPDDALRAGFGENGSFIGHLHFKSTADGTPGYDPIYAAQNYIGVKNSPQYDASRSLIATSANYYATFELGIENPKDYTSLFFGPASYISTAIGKVPPANAEIAKVVRPIMIKDIGYKPPVYYAGNMTVYVWKEDARGS